MEKKDLLNVLEKYEKELGLISRDKIKECYSNINALLFDKDDDYEIEFYIDSKKISTKDDVDEIYNKYLKINNLGYLYQLILEILKNNIQYLKNIQDKTGLLLENKTKKLKSNRKKLDIFFWVTLIISSCILGFSFVVIALFFIDKEKYNWWFTIAGVLDFTCGLAFFIYEITSDKLHNEVEIESIEGVSNIISSNIIFSKKIKNSEINQESNSENGNNSNYLVAKTIKNSKANQTKK